MSRNHTEESLDFISILLRVWRWKFSLLLIAAAGGALALIFSMLQPPLYRTFASVFPANNDKPDSYLAGANFGFDIHGERLIQMLDCDPMYDSMIKRFNLIEHYEIDVEKPSWHDDLMKKYYKRISFNKTLLSSVMIIVLDEHPDTAAAMANYLAKKVNDIHSNIIRRSSAEARQKLEKSVAEKEASIRQIADSISRVRGLSETGASSAYQQRIASGEQELSSLRKQMEDLRNRTGITDFGQQISILTEKVASSRSEMLEAAGREKYLLSKPDAPDTLLLEAQLALKGAENRLSFFEKNLSELNRVHREYHTLEQQITVALDLQQQARSDYEAFLMSTAHEFQNEYLDKEKSTFAFELEQLKRLKEKLKTVTDSYNDPPPASFIVSEARPSYKKFSPQKMINTVIGSAFGFFAGLFFLLFAERLRIARQKIGGE